MPSSVMSYWPVPEYCVRRTPGTSATDLPTVSESRLAKRVALSVPSIVMYTTYVLSITRKSEPSMIGGPELIAEGMRRR